MDSTSYLFHTPDKVYADRNLIDEKVRNISQSAHYLYYLSSVVYLSDFIKKTIDYEMHNVYCVRYLIDTVVSHRCAGLEVSMQYEEYNILKPDLTIFVTLNEKIRQSRIEKRGRSLLDKELDCEERRKAFLNEFDNQLEGAIFFDNGIGQTDIRLKNLYRQYIQKEKHYYVS